MKTSVPQRVMLLISASLILGACGTMPQPYNGPSMEMPDFGASTMVFPTMPTVVMPTGNYNEWHTTGSSSTKRDSNTTSQGGCTGSEITTPHENGISTTRSSKCNSSSQTKSTSKTKSRSSSVGVNVNGPVGAVLGMIHQMNDMNDFDDFDAASNDMFKQFGF